MAQRKSVTSEAAFVVPFVPRDFKMRAAQEIYAAFLFKRKYDTSGFVREQFWA